MEAVSLGKKLGGAVVSIGLGCLLGNTIGGLVTGRKTFVESIWDSAKERYENYQAFKEEGIDAASYDEALRQLDSIRTDRLYREHGMTPPQPEESEIEQMIKMNKLHSALIEDNLQQLHDLSVELSAITNTLSE